MQLREARAIETDEWNHRLGTLAHILIAANSDPEKRSDVPKWYEIFSPISICSLNDLAEHQQAPDNTPPAEITGKLLDAITLRHKEEAKKRRGRRLTRRPNA